MEKTMTKGHFRPCTKIVEPATPSGLAPARPAKSGTISGEEGRAGTLGSGQLASGASPAHRAGRARSGAGLRTGTGHDRPPVGGEPGIGQGPVWSGGVINNGRSVLEKIKLRAA